MPRTMQRTELLKLARLGAQARLATLDRERAEILRSFPGIRRAATGSLIAANGQTRRRRRGGMSAASRKAVSARMKKYWANWRKEHGK